MYIIHAVAPMKALCSERFTDWQAKFGPLGLHCCELTGDSQLDDYFELQSAQIVMTTPVSQPTYHNSHRTFVPPPPPPLFLCVCLSVCLSVSLSLSLFLQEKWDSMTRRWRDHKSLVQLVRLFLIDEVHQLNDEVRGPTVEAIVSRMKTIRAAGDHGGREGGGVRGGPGSLRLIAVSATIPNISDVCTYVHTFLNLLTLSLFLSLSLSLLSSVAGWDLKKILHWNTSMVAMCGVL